MPPKAPPPPKKATPPPSKIQVKPGGGGKPSKQSTKVPKKGIDRPLRKQLEERKRLEMNDEAYLDRLEKSRSEKKRTRQFTGAELAMLMGATGGAAVIGSSEAGGTEGQGQGQEQEFFEDLQWRPRKRTLIEERRRKMEVLNNTKKAVQNWFEFTHRSKKKEDDKEKDKKKKEKEKDEEGKEEDDENANKKKPPSPEPRFKKPVEKLLQRVKKEHIEDIPRFINIHRHRALPKSFIRNSGTKKQVRIIHRILKKHNREVQPNFGFEYNKRQKRLLLGRRHRKLEKGFKYFEPIKSVLPRKLRPNNHYPDAIFYFLNVFIFITMGIPVGTAVGIRSFFWVMEDAKDFELSLESGWTADQGLGNQYWATHGPFTKMAKTSLIFNSLICSLIIIGFVGVYLAKQSLHWVYFTGMFICFLSMFMVSLDIQKEDYCAKLLDHAQGVINLLLDHYNHTVEAYDLNGNPVSWTNPETQQVEVVKLRTYKAANIMDRMQKSWKCCGGDKGFEDYLDRGMKIPSSCCNPLWNLNPYCAEGGLEDKDKLLTPFDEDNEIGCHHVLEHYCDIARNSMGSRSLIILIAQFALFLVSCFGLILQARQIRQLKRDSHLRISAGTISQSLQTYAGADPSLTNRGGGVQAVANATQLTEKQAEHIQQLRNEAAKYLQDVRLDLDTSSGSASTDEGPVHTVDFKQMKNLQDFVEAEDLPEVSKQNVEKAVEGFAGRFNIVANKNLRPYIPGIFSSTYQNETNAGLEAINMILERQFAQHTTDYDWKKLLIKPKKKDHAAMNAALEHLQEKEKAAESESQMKINN